MSPVEEFFFTVCDAIKAAKRKGISDEELIRTLHFIISCRGKEPKFERL